MLYKKFDVRVDSAGFENIMLGVNDIPNPQVEELVDKRLRFQTPPPPSDIIHPKDLRVSQDFVLPPPPPPEEDQAVSFFKVESKPELIGGQASIFEYINKHDLLPKKKSELGISGRALIGFTVNTKGLPEEVRVMQEKPEGFGFGEAGMEVMKAMRFYPGILRDEYVSVTMHKQIKFTAKVDSLKE